jgi:hypothetical protein
MVRRNPKRNVSPRIRSPESPLLHLRSFIIHHSSFIIRS